MTIDIVVPMFAEGAESIQLRQWLVAVGDEVEKDQNLAEATTDKIAIFIESPESGVIASLDAEEEDHVQVGQVIGTIEVK
jgi:pyruvate/2-oxoglutarate dehydrogenase complex dihydrolipoamide acyltransferase (E2) component